MDKQIVDLVVGHKWVALAALLIGLLVRLLKSDTNTIPVVVPAKWRPWIALGLGLVAGVLDRVAAGTPWTEALVAGAVAGLLPVIGHQYLIESLRDGKEIGGNPPPTQKGTSGGGPTAGILLTLCLGLVSMGCAGSFEEAKLAGRGYSATAAAPEPSARCRELDDARGQWSAIAKAAGVVSGAGGIASIPVTPEVRPYVVGGVVVFLTAGAYALIRSENASAAWVRECSQ